MYRGSTPKFTFPVTFPVDSLSDFVLTFEQGDKIILRKTLDDCEVYTEIDPRTKKPRNTISIRLTVDESMMFEPARQLHIQLRALMEDGIQLVTKELTTYVYDTLYDGEIPMPADNQTTEDDNSGSGLGSSLGASLDGTN